MKNSLRSSIVVAATVLIGSPLLAQAGHPLAPYGVGQTVPDEHATAYGTASTGRPLAGSPNRFQQVIDAGDLPDLFMFHSLGFRKNDQLETYPGHTVELEILIGYTTLDRDTLTNDFAANFDVSPPDVALARGNVVLPTLPWARPADLEEFVVQVRLDEPYEWGQLGYNMLIEIVNYGNDLGGSAFTYPLDSGSGTDASMLIGNGAAATNGLLLRGNGLAMRLLTDEDRAAGFAGRFTPGASGGAMPPKLMGAAPPIVGGAAAVQLDAPGFDLALLALSTEQSPNLVFPVNRYALPVYTDPAHMLGTVSVAMTGGQGFTEIAIPNLSALMGMDMLWQGFTAQSQNPALIGATNALFVNLGDSAAGLMDCAMQHTDSIAASSYLQNSANQPQNIHCESPTSSGKISVSGTKNTVVGPLEIRVTDANGNVVTTVSVPREDDRFTRSVDVPQGGYVYLYNADTSAPMNVTYEVDVLK